MNSAEWREIKALFTSALDLHKDERAAFLAHRPVELRIEVEKLLTANDEADNFIAEPACVGLGMADPDKCELLTGKQIDSYKIVRKIGHGGMGTVYLANRADGSFDKPVAIKLIKRGMDTSAVLKRFSMERRILAQLQHPNIANLIDGGTTGDGLPYFVMEYVEGEPITKFCDTHRFSTHLRLRLFQKVCSAISHAHQNLVVHRDIKPSNILVTDDGEPKLLDFGIAKMLHPDWSLDTNEATATMFRIMTPEYASPEQIQGLPITTSSDVYSLGVVLYELLSGKRPYKIESRTTDEAARVVLTEEPVKPSSVVSCHRQPGKGETIPTDANSTGEHTEKDTGDAKPIRVSNSAFRDLKGDLDNIVLKALRKEPERRYQSVQEFSEDIRRHLVGLPVTASADTVSYRFAKFVKRHRAGVFAGAVIFLTLLAATTVTTWQATVARRERDKAEQRFNQVRKLANTVLFDYHDSIAKLAGSTPIRQKMLQDSVEYLDSLSVDASADENLQREIATAYEKIGDITGGDDTFGKLNQGGNSLLNYQKALKIREKLAGDQLADPKDSFAYAVCLGKTADGLGVSGDFQSRLENYQKAAAIYETVANSDPFNRTFQFGLASGLFDLGFASDQAGENEDAIANYSRALRIWERLSDGDTSGGMVERRLSRGYKFLGRVLEREKSFDEAAQNYSIALALDQSRVSRDAEDAQAQLDLSASYITLANLFIKTEKIEDAETFCQKGLKIREEAVKVDSENTVTLVFLARGYDTLGLIRQKKLDLDGAAKSFRKAIDIFTRPQNIDTSDFISNNYLTNFYNHLGSSEMELSRRSQFPAQRKKHILLARDCYVKSVEILKKLQEHNSVTTRNESSIEDIMKKIEACDKALQEV